MIDHSISHFWEKYISKTRAYGVKAGTERWYVRHAEKYIKSHKGLKLAQHNAQNVERYLKEKGRTKWLEDWQYKQMVMSIKILFNEMLQISWADTFPWDEYILHAESLPNNHATVVRDYQEVNLASISQGLVEKGEQNTGLFKRVYEQYPQHIENLIKVIRVKHYSIRTEQSYLGWFCVIFHFTK